MKKKSLDKPIPPSAPSGSIPRFTVGVSATVMDDPEALREAVNNGYIAHADSILVHEGVVNVVPVLSTPVTQIRDRMHVGTGLGVAVNRNDLRKTIRDAIMGAEIIVKANQKPEMLNELVAHQGEGERERLHLAIDSCVDRIIDKIHKPHKTLPANGSKIDLYADLKVLLSGLGLSEGEHRVKAKEEILDRVNTALDLYAEHHKFLLSETSCSL